MANGGEGGEMSKSTAAVLARETMLAVTVWFILFGFTVQIGFSYRLFGALFTEPAATMSGGAFNLILLIPLRLFHKKTTHTLLKIESWKTVVPALILVIAGALVPLHYHYELPVWTYIFFMTVSVFWQNYITFGLLHGYLRKAFTQRTTVLILAILFSAAHLVFVSDFWRQPVNILFVLVLASLFTFLREKTGTLYWLIFIHLMFYFIVC
jgi:hypothetical protein